MGIKGYSTIPSTLLESITFLARVLPLRSVSIFIELLIGGMLTQTGFVTGAWLAINPLRTWTAYYKWLQKGKWSWVALGVQLARWILVMFPQSTWSRLTGENCSELEQLLTLPYQRISQESATSSSVSCQ